MYVEKGLASLEKTRKVLDPEMLTIMGMIMVMNLIMVMTLIMKRMIKMMKMVMNKMTTTMS